MFDITVGITTYNRTDYLKQAVNSVLQQTHKDFQLIISNDNPKKTITFDGLGICRDGRVKIINQEKNLGVLNNMNYILAIAGTDWLMWLSEDDLLHPQYLEIGCNKIIEDKNIVGVFSNYISSPEFNNAFSGKLDKSGKIIDSSQNDKAEFLEAYTLRKYPTVGECGLMKVEILKEIGGMPKLGSGPGHYSDTLLPILLLEHGNVCWVEKPLVFFRASNDSISHSSTDFQAYTSAEQDFIDHLRRVCRSKAIAMDPAKPIANMVKWFSLVEWQVLSRTPGYGTIDALYVFAKHQIKVNFQWLSFYRKISHGLFLVRRAMIVAFKKIFKFDR